MKDVDRLIVSWIVAVEKLRRGIPLDIPMRAVFEWITTPWFHRTIKMKYRQKGFQGVKLFPIGRKDMLNEIELYECISEGPEEENCNYEPGRIYVSRVSEDGSISERMIEYFPEDFHREEPDFDLKEGDSIDPDDYYIWFD